MKLHIGENKLNIDFNLPYSENYRIDTIARLLKFLHLLSADGTELSIEHDESRFTAHLDKAISLSHNFFDLWKFSEFLTLLLLRHSPDNRVEANLNDLAKLYYAQKGTFSLISSIGEHGNFRIENAPTRHAPRLTMRSFECRPVVSTSTATIDFISGAISPPPDGN